MLTLYVVANGDLFREGLNALVTFLGEDAFQSFTRIATAFSIYGVILAIIKHRDFTEMFKWFVMMVFFTTVMVAPKTDLAIYDSSTPGAVLEVDNVPVSLAWIGSTLTSLSFGVTTAMETAFHLPSDLSYSTTGMLFGAKMFQASHDFRILNPDLIGEMNDYIQNCILGDIRINQKYTMKELKESEALWNTVSKNPSPVRRMVFDKEILACSDATPKMEASLKEEINQNAIVLYGKKLFGTKSQSYEALFNQYLSASYNYFINASQASTDIFMQSMLVNAMKEGIQNYAAMSDNPASLQDYAVTKSEIQARMTWATLGIEATYFLPVIQTVLLLLLVCLFPFVAVLSLMPNGFSQWGNYLRSFAYLGLWPPLFAIINMAMNYYLQARTSVFTGVSMNNFDALAQLHYDSSVIAGYLSLCVPFLAMGLVTNRVLHAISNPVTSILGGLQSGVSSAAMETASGNFSMGNTNYGNRNAENASLNNVSYNNTSYNNTNANKHDTDWTEFHGTITEQMASGVMKTTTEDGQIIYNVSSGMSNLAQSINLGSQLSSTLSQSAEKAHQSAITESDNVQSSLSHAASRFVQLGESLSHDDRDNDHASMGLSSSENRALSFLDSKADEISKNEHISKNEAYKVLGTMAYSSDVGSKIDTSKGIIGKVAENSIGINGHVGASSSYNYSDISERSDNYTRNDTHGLTSREAQEVSQAFHTIASQQKTQSNDVSDSRSRALVDNLASDLRQAETSAHNRDVSFSESQRLSTLATQAQTASASWNSNLNQAFVNYVREREGDARADALFSNTGALSSQAQLQSLAQSFTHHMADGLMQGDAKDFMSSVDPEQTFKAHSSAPQAIQSLLNENQQANHEILGEKRTFQTTHGIKDNILENVSQNLNATQSRVNRDVINQNWQEHQQEVASMEERLEEGKHDATTWTTPIIGHAIPSYGRSREEKLNNKENPE